MDLRENKGLTPVESGFPITSSTIDLTMRCNLACKYCFAHCFEKYDGADLTPEMGKKIVDWLMAPSTHGGASKVDISFWGGEPLLKWDLLQEIVLYAEEKAKEQGIEIVFGGTTNVTLLTPDKFDFMDEHRIRFLLSIDGTKEHHDANRVFKNGKGSWDIIDKNVDAIIQRWPDAQVRFSYTAENIEGLLDDVKYLYSKGFKNIVYSPVSEGDWTEGIEKIDKVWDSVADWYIERKRKGEPITLKFLEDGCKAQFGYPRGDSAPCGAGRGYVGITVQGAIYPCHRFNKMDDKSPWYEREVCLGHIDYGILNQQWRENFTKWNPDKDMMESCKNCKAHKLSCTGQCWATNWDNLGTLNKILPVNCRIELATLNQGAKVANVLGTPFLNEMLGPIYAAPPVQGCECYNVRDNLFNRQTVNTGDRYACLCNMSTYGVRPNRPDKCNCYNVEDMSQGYKQGFFDNTGASCKNFQASPVDMAIAYLKNKSAELEKLTEAELKAIEEFDEQKRLVEAKAQELQTLQDVSKDLKNS